jgi:hypothetical protein
LDKKNNFHNRDDFKKDFENDLIEPLLQSVNETIIKHKNLFSKEEIVNETKIMLSE